MSNTQYMPMNTDDAKTKQTILFVDDYLPLLNTLEQAFGDDYHVLCASTGQGAIKSATKHHPDLIVLDIDLGTSSGFEVCRILKSLDLVSNIPVLIYTAESSHLIEHKVRSLGAESVVQKDGSLRHIKQKVLQFLPPQ